MDKKTLAGFFRHRSHDTVPITKKSKRRQTSPDRLNHNARSHCRPISSGARAFLLSDTVDSSTRNDRQRNRPTSQRRRTPGTHARRNGSGAHTHLQKLSSRTIFFSAPVTSTTTPNITGTPWSPTTTYPPSEKRYKKIHASTNTRRWHQAMFPS